MLFINEYEIDDMLLTRFRFGNTPNLYLGAQILDRLMRWTNANSDGWAYWPLPTRAAKKLMELLNAADFHDPEDCDAAALNKACIPIKAFLTRQGVDHAEVFPTVTEVEKPAATSEEHSTLDVWARTLTDSRLAADLERLADNIRWVWAEERTARLREAARRLANVEQVLVTLADGSQVFVKTRDPNVTIQFRKSLGGSWSLPFESNDRPHQPSTIYVGEW
jgi:hypothetical protein